MKADATKRARSLSAAVAAWFAVAALAVLCFTVITAAAAADVFIPDSDVLLNSLSSSALYGAILDIKPVAFNPTDFMSALATFYVTAGAAAAAASGATTNDVGLNMFRLVEWCLWTNSTLTVSPTGNSYCAFGAEVGTVAAALPTNTLFTFRYSGPLTPSSIVLATPLNLDATYGKLVSAGITPLLVLPDTGMFDPDLQKNALDDDASYIQVVYNDSVAFWAIFGSVIGLLVVGLIGTGVCCVRREYARRRAMSTPVLERVRARAAKAKVRREKMGAMQRKNHGNGGAGQHLAHMFSGGSRTGGYGDSNGHGGGDVTRNYYDVPGYGREGIVDSGTTRASDYWPGADNSNDSAMKNRSKKNAVVAGDSHAMRPNDGEEEGSGDHPNNSNNYEDVEMRVRRENNWSSGSGGASKCSY